MKLTSLEDLAYNLSCAVNCLEAVHELMVEGPSDPKCFTDALYFVSTTIRGYSEELTNCVNKAFAQVRKGAANGKAN